MKRTYQVPLEPLRNSKALYAPPADTILILMVRAESYEPYRAGEQISRSFGRCMTKVWEVQEGEGEGEPPR